MGKMAKHNAAYNVLEAISMSRQNVKLVINQISINDGEVKTPQDIIRHVSDSENLIKEYQQRDNVTQTDSKTLESFSSILNVIKRIAALNKLNRSTSAKEIEDLIASLSIEEDKMYAQSGKDK